MSWLVNTLSGLYVLVEFCRLSLAHFCREFLAADQLSDGLVNEGVIQSLIPAGEKEKEICERKALRLSTVGGCHFRSLGDFF